VQERVTHSGAEAGDEDLPQEGADPSRPWFAVILLLVLAAGAWLISRRLPEKFETFTEADSLENWATFGLRVLRETLQAASLAAVAIAVSAWVPQVGRWLERMILQSPRRAFLAVTITLAILSSAAFSRFAYSHFPHIQDEIANVFQARLFARGELYAEKPELFEFFDWEYIVADGPRWYSKYFFGPALLMVPGVWLGVPWLMNPLLAGAAVWLTYAIGRALIDEKIGRVAAVLMVISPMRVNLFALMMAHPACLVSLALFGLGVVQVVKNPRRTGWALAAGVGLGFAGNCRPLTAAAMGGTVLLLAAWAVIKGSGFGVQGSAEGVRRSGRGRFPLRCVLAFVLPLAGFAAAFLSYNHALTGDAWQTPFGKWSQADRLGFGPDVGMEYWHGADRGHSLNKALFRNGYYSLEGLGKMLTGWGFVTFLLILVPVVRSRWPTRARMLGFVAAAPVVAYLFYHHTDRGVALEGRYWSEAMPAFMLLVAIALAGVRHRMPLLCLRIGLVPAVRTGRAACWLAGALLTLWSLPNAYWPLINECSPDLWGEDEALRVPRLVNEAGLVNGLVFVESDHYRHLPRLLTKGDLYGFTFVLNDPALNSPIVYARDLGDRNVELMRKYPGRSAYRFVRDTLGPDRLEPITFPTTAPPGQDSNSVRRDRAG
jgi:hypothetical protein